MNAERGFVLQSMIKASRLAGLAIRAAFDNPTATAFKTKSNSSDLVTETDVRCQELIVSSLLADFPRHRIVGEESLEGTDFVLSDQETFIIDPIDGTSNFAKLVPHCAVLVSRAVNKKVDCAVVLDPFRAELFYATIGEGAYLNLLDRETLQPTEIERRLRVNEEIKTLKEATVLTDLGYTRNVKGVALFAELQRNLLVNSPGAPVRALRVMGSCGLGLAWVACGRADCYVERNGPLIWDFSGGALLVTEAGGVILDPSGGPLDLTKRSVLGASSRELADVIVGCVLQSDRDAESWMSARLNGSADSRW